MAFVITSACIDVKDASCVDVCPVDCITFEPDVDRKLFINPDECIECAACEAACPVSAIFSQDSVPESERAFIEIDALYYKDKAAARSRVEEIAAKVKQ